MDPEVVYAKITELCKSSSELTAYGDAEGRLNEITEHWEILDTWLRTGGFLPSSWNSAKIQEIKSKPYPQNLNVDIDEDYRDIL